MRSSKSRSRSKSNRQRSLGNVVNRVFDSSGPEGKVRGTPQQIIEKYLALARDAQLSNDRVAEQAFLQHAEHYTRMLGEAQREQAERQQHQNQNPQHQNGRHGDDQQSRGHDDSRDASAPRDDDGAAHRAEAGHDRHDRRAVADPAEAPQPMAQYPDSQPAEAQPVEDRAPAHPRSNRRPQAALPDAMSTDTEAEESRVATPEDSASDEKAPARRPRAPRSAAPRTRRKPAAEGEAAAPADSAEQG